MGIGSVKGPSEPTSPEPSKTPVNLKPLVIQFREQIQNAKNAENPQFVEEVAHTIKQIYEGSTGKGKEELIKNLHAMLNAPLLLPDGTETSLYQAANFSPHDQLAHLLAQHVQYPESTHLFLQELDDLIKDF